MKARLDKVLTAGGLGSRSTVKKLLRKRVVCVNGSRITDASFLIETETDTLTVDGEIFAVKENIYLMLNKPAGCVTSTRDPKHKTVIELLKPPFDKMNLFPIGRLDIDTEGLIILTDDGKTAHKITSPKSGIVKTYYLEFVKEPSCEEIERYTAEFKSGIVLKNGYRCLPAGFEKTENVTGSGKSGFLIHITEGKYHQIKKMSLAAGNEICYLKRIAVASVHLDPLLKKGEYRELTEAEINTLKGI